MIKMIIIIIIMSTQLHGCKNKEKTSAENKHILSIRILRAL